MDSYIFHIDVNSAFLSWSALKKLQEEPGSVDLRTIPSAVGGDVETRHGIITAKSIPAKKYGVQTGEPVVKALQKCPHLVMVRSDFQTYRKYSHAFIDILHEYTDQVEQVSIDEAYLDTSGLESVFGKQTGQGAGNASSDIEYSHYPYPLNLAYHIKNTVYQRLGFTVNVGISTNRLLAKMASDFTKPDKVHTLFPEEVPEKMWPLPVRELHGCGRATAEKLENIGIRTIGDAAHADLKILQSLLGDKGGSYIHRSANGISRSSVMTDRGDAKSYSNETTTAFDITEDNFEKEALPIIRHLSEKVAARMERDEVYAGTIDVSVKTDAFQRRSRQMKLQVSTHDEEVIYQTAEKLMRQLLLGRNGLFSKGYHIRLIGVGGSGLDRGEFRQVGFLEAMTQLQEIREQKTAVSDIEKQQKTTVPDIAEKQKKTVLSDIAEKQQKHNEEGAGQQNRPEEDPANEKQKRLTNNADERQKRLDRMREQITGRFGADAIRKGVGAIQKDADAIQKGAADAKKDAGSIQKGAI
ncbi:MAG: DNA polymerase IV [Eubacterium sp.]|nr:DNA polymerase IV [Eubacterium sp.]